MYPAAGRVGWDSYRPERTAGMASTLGYHPGPPPAAEPCPPVSPEERPTPSAPRRAHRLGPPLSSMALGVAGLLGATTFGPVDLAAIPAIGVGPVKAAADASERVIERCVASHYTDTVTASGEPYVARAMVAAHKSLKLGSWVTVRNEATGRSVRVRINDRGPYIAGRCIDLTPAAFDRIAPVNAGIVPVILAAGEPETDPAR